jgi:ABC-type dipeptide/oligopeptide/nickel transport system permease subunit
MVDVSLTLSSLNDNDLKPTLSLYACALDDRPQHVDDPRVIETCRVTADLASVAPEHAETIMGTTATGQQLLYKIAYTIRIEFIFSMRILRGTLTAYGKNVGNIDLQL